MSKMGGRRDGGSSTVGMTKADDASTRRIPTASVNSDVKRSEKSAPHLTPPGPREA